MKKFIYVLCFISCLFFMRSSNFVLYACANQSNVETSAKIFVPNVNNNNNNCKDKSMYYKKIHICVFDVVKKNKILRKVTYQIPCNVKYRKRKLGPLQLSKFFN